MSLAIHKPTKYLGSFTSDPTGVEAGEWWYRSDLRIFRFYDGTETRSLPIRYRSASATVTIPIGGGDVPVKLTLTGLSAITILASIKVTRKVPVVRDVYETTYAGITGNVVGLTLHAGTGTTLVTEVEALGPA